MHNQELDYDIPSRPLVCAWMSLAIGMVLLGLWLYPLWVMITFLAVMLVWMNFYSTAMHYALDAERFTRFTLVGEAFVTFQSHHFPKWINVIHRKPVLDLIGELTPLAVLNIVPPLLLFRVHTQEVLVTWGTMMLVSAYGMICHRWAHQPPGTRPRAAKRLQRAHLALDPAEHWKHHALAAAPNGAFVPNFDLSFGWSNPFFNRVLKAQPSPWFWIIFLAVVTFTQVWVLAHLLHWLVKI